MYIPSSVKCLIMAFAHFYIGLFCYYWVLSVLCIFWIPLFVFCKYFLSVHCLSFHSRKNFFCKAVLNFNGAQLISILCHGVFGVVSKNSSLNSCYLLEVIHFCILHLALWYISVNFCEKCLNSFSHRWMFSCSSTIRWEDYPFSIGWLFALIKLKSIRVSQKNFLSRQAFVKKNRMFLVQQGGYFPPARARNMEVFLLMFTLRICLGSWR